jgi:hypothetical protein
MPIVIHLPCLYNANAPESEDDDVLWIQRQWVMFHLVSCTDIDPLDYNVLDSIAHCSFWYIFPKIIRV